MLYAIQSYFLSSRERSPVQIKAMSSITKVGRNEGDLGGQRTERRDRNIVGPQSSVPRLYFNK